MAVLTSRFAHSWSAFLFFLSFSLKIFFDTPELPWYLHVHGAVLTAWFALFLAQTVLVARHRTAAHRRLGRLASVMSVPVILTTFFLILGANAATEARGITRTLPIEVLVLGDFAMLAAFSVLLTIGVAFRHKPAFHKRAMLLASIALVTPAVPRLARLPLFVEAGPALVPAVIVSLMLAIWAHDLLSERRLHAATVFGSVLILGGFQLASLFAGTDSGKAFVASISFTSG